MELGDWQHKFASRILERGENYYIDGAVQSMKWNGKKISATVSGTETYKVKITVSDGVVGDMSCSCPYADVDNCKHMAAVLFAASEDDFPDSDRDWIRRNKMSLEDAVQSLSESDAKELLLQCAKASDSVADKIFFKATGGVGREQVRKWMKEVSALSREYCGRRKYVRYEDVSRYLNDMGELMAEKVHLLLDAGLPADAFALTCKAWDEIGNVGLEDADHETETFYWVCADYWRDILPHMNRKEQRQMFDWIAKQYGNGGDNDAEIDDTIVNFLFGDSVQEPAFQEPEFLERKLKVLDEWIPRSDRYFLEKLVLRRLDCMERLSMSREEKEQFIRKYDNLPKVRQRLMEERSDKT